MSKTILDGVTDVTYTGGSSLTFVEQPSNTAGTTYVDTTGTSGLRDSIRLVGRPGSLNPTTGGVQQKAKSTAVATMVVQDAVTGEIRFGSIRIEVTVDPRDASALLAELRNRGCQILSEDAYANLFIYGQEA